MKENSKSARNIDETIEYYSMQGAKINILWKRILKMHEIQDNIQ